MIIVKLEASLGGIISSVVVDGGVDVVAGEGITAKTGRAGSIVSGKTGKRALAGFSDEGSAEVELNCSDLFSLDRIISTDD